MKEFITILVIAIALSMDTFSLSLGIGTCNLTKRKMLTFSTIVGIMHFIMPLIGILIGNTIISVFVINSNFLLGVILIYLAVTMLFDLLKQEEPKMELTLLNIILISFSVSIDSFSTGLGLQAITDNTLIAVMIFSMTSFCFTYLGLLIGKYANKVLGTYATILGAILLICIGLVHLCQ